MAEKLERKNEEKKHKIKEKTVCTTLSKDI